MDEPREGVVFALSREEYAEIVGTMIALRDLGQELAATFRASAGRKHGSTRGAEQIVTASTRVLNILRYRE
jgi:hypothetical protein